MAGNVYGNGSKLAGHATTSVPGVEISTGSLGHGLPIACGMALAAQRGGYSFRGFTVLSDGECDGGSGWESALFAPQHRPGHLTVIADHNTLHNVDTSQ